MITQHRETQCKYRSFPHVTLDAHVTIMTLYNPVNNR